MTADLSLNTKLLSLGEPHQNGRPAVPLPWGASFGEGEHNARYLDLMSAADKSTSTSALQLLCSNSAGQAEMERNRGLLDS